VLIFREGKWNQKFLKEVFKFLDCFDDSSVLVMVHLLPVAMPRAEWTPVNGAAALLRARQVGTVFAVVCLPGSGLKGKPASMRISVSGDKGVFSNVPA
jgi:hypothetical protein